jgi:hypothetical protein
MKTDPEGRRTGDPNVRYYHVTSDGSSSSQLKTPRAPAVRRKRSTSFWVLMAVVAIIIVMVIVLIVIASLDEGAAGSASLEPVFAALVSA